MHRFTLALAVLTFATVLILSTLETAYCDTDDVFLVESYWGSKGEKTVVGPGDKYVELTVVLSSGYDGETLTGIVGRLELPEGMRSTDPRDPRVATSFYRLRVMPGETFEMTFILDLSGLNAIGTYTGRLHLTYTVLGDVRVTKTVNVPIVVTGRPNLKVSLEGNEVQSGIESVLPVTVANVGSSPASDVTVELRTDGRGQLFFVENSKFRIGTMLPGQSMTFLVRAFAPPASSDLASIATLRLTYVDPAGREKVVEEVVGIKIKRVPLSDVDLRIWIEGDVMRAGGSGTVQLHVQNVGRATAEDVTIRFEPNNFGVAPIGESASIYLPRLEPMSEMTFELRFETSKSVLPGTYLLPITVSYRDLLGNQASNRYAVSLLVGESEPRSPGIILFTTSSITAGSPQKLVMNVRNRSGDEVRDLNVKVSPSPGLELLGRNDYFIERLGIDEEVRLSLEVYAPPSSSGKAASLKIDLQYVKAGTDEIVSESTSLGILVRGLVKLTIHDVGVRKFGDSVVLYGNLINEGNSPALFTTVGFLPETQGVVARSTYIGEVSPNTLIPFNVELSGLKEGSGTLVGKLTIYYRDDLREEHIVVSDVSTEYVIESGSPEGGQSVNYWQVSTIAIAIAAIAIVSTLTLRRRAKKVEAI